MIRRLTALIVFKVSNGAVITCTTPADMEGKDFLDMAHSKTLKEQTSFQATEDK